VAEEIEVVADQLLAALDALVDRKTPISMAPINRLREQIEAPGTSEVSARAIVRALVEAGYNVDDIRWFFEEAGIVRDADDWVRMKMDVERAVILALIERERGG